MDLAPFRDLKERDLRRQGLSVGEGHLVVERMLRSGWRMHSVLCTPALAERFEPLAAGRCPVYVLPEEEIRRVAGFPFHRGVMAAAFRPEPVSIEAVLQRVPQARLLVLCPDLTDAENLGVIIRSAKGLGSDGLLLGPRACDPYLRRVLRVSMGAVFDLPMGRMTDEDADLAPLRARGFQILGAVLDAGAMPLTGFRPSGPVALVLGNEGSGLDAAWKERCDALLTIPMSGGVDSLNVGVAAGIFLYALARPGGA